MVRRNVNGVNAQSFVCGIVGCVFRGRPLGRLPFISVRSDALTVPPLGSVISMSNVARSTVRERPLPPLPLAERAPLCRPLPLVWRPPLPLAERPRAVCDTVRGLPLLLLGASEGRSFIGAIFAPVGSSLNSGRVG